METFSALLKRYKFKDVPIIIILTLVYFVAGKLGLRLAFFNPSATPIWAPTGIAITAFIFLGFGVWPAILIGAFLVNLTTAGTVITSLGIALGNTLEGLGGAYLVNRFIGKPNLFTRPGDVFKYIILAGVVATSISATVGTTTLLLGGLARQSDYPSVWLTWWLGDMGGALIVAPVLILWIKNHKLPRNIYQILERLVAFILLIVVCQFIFTSFISGTFLGFSLVLLIIPILVLIAFRFGPREISVALLVTYVIAALGTLKNTGPFARPDPNQSLLILQIFMGIMFIGKMPLAAASHELKESEEKYKKLIATSPDAILVTDLLGRIQVVDREALKMYDLNDDTEIVGKSGFDFIAPEDLGRTEKVLSNLLKEGEVSKVEYTSVRKDGSRFDTSANATLIVNDQGEPEGIMVVARDVTKEKAADKAKSEFVSLASHQLRTPLGISKWYLEALGNEEYIRKAPTQVRKYFDEIYTSNERVLSLVRDLLSVSRIDQGRVKNTPKVADLVKLISEVVKQMQIVARKKRIDLILDIKDKNLPSVKIDTLRFQEVMENLIVNAIEYSKENETIKVELEKDNDMLVIQVKDSGIGISVEDQKKLFTKFFRAEKAVEQNPEGSGLGLYVVKSYVEGWGGKISVDSTEQKGSVFKINLPLSQK